MQSSGVLDERALPRYGQREKKSRKKFLFVGHDDAGQNLAGLYALVASCEAHGVNPVEYLRDVLIRIQTHPASRIDDLLPGNWRAPPRDGGL